MGSVIELFNSNELFSIFLANAALVLLLVEILFFCCLSARCNKKGSLTIHQNTNRNLQNVDNDVSSRPSQINNYDEIDENLMMINDNNINENPDETVHQGNNLTPHYDTPGASKQQMVKDLNTTGLKK